MKSIHYIYIYIYIYSQANLKLTNFTLYLIMTRRKTRFVCIFLPIRSIAYFARPLSHVYIPFVCNLILLWPELADPCKIEQVFMEFAALVINCFIRGGYI